MPARSCRANCSRIVRPARASSTPRRCRSTRSRPSSSRPTRKNLDVARLHSGDLSIYSALAEQLRRLERHGIPYTLTPGVPAFAAAAAALECELTVPEVAQSVVLTRVSGRASRMPETREARDLRRDRRDARHPSGDPRHRNNRRGADAVLRRRLSGRRRGAGELADAAHRARHARRYRGARSRRKRSSARR